VDSYVSGDGLRAAAYRQSSAAVDLPEILMGGKKNSIVYHFLVRRVQVKLFDRQKVGQEFSQIIL
jgi:hypothetical protein